MKRDSLKFIKNYLEQSKGPFNVLIIRGARQVGKSTLVEDAIKELPHLTINLERDKSIRFEIDHTQNFSEFSLLLKNKFQFTPDGSKILFIDEAQESEQLNSYVREFKETWGKCKVILTGSSMSKFFSENNRVPVGRIENLLIHPFSFREFLRYHQKEELIQEAYSLVSKDAEFPMHLHQMLLRHLKDYLLIGGLPDVVKAFPDPKYKDLIQDLFLTQREDFYRKENFDTHLFTEALRSIANNVGYPSKYSHIPATQYLAKKVISSLENWNLIYSVDVKGAITAQNISTKRYVYDLGILRYLRNTPVPEIDIIETLNDALRQPLGGVIENSFLLNHIQLQKNIGFLSTWKKNSKDNLEVDFVIDFNNQKLPVEVKASLNTTERHLKSIIQYLNYYKLKKGVLISLDKPKKFKIDHFEISNKPVYLAI